MKFLIAVVVFGVVAAARAATIDLQILKNLEEAETTTVIVSFKNANSKAALSRFQSLRLSSREAKLNTMYSILKDHADSVQADVMSLLKKTETAKKHVVSQLWISAQIVVRSVDREIVQLLRDHPDVEYLEAEQFLPLDDVIEEEYVPLNASIQNQWGVDLIRPDPVWNAGYRGGQTVVGIVDTGARHTHVALQATYRGNQLGTHDYSWFVPSGGSAAAPSDANGHGTHVIGTIAGTVNGIGVAPEALWIHCRGCNGASCSTADLLGCGNWIACPTTTTNTAPDCTRAPRVVNNSWGGGQGSTFYDGILTAWANADIVPVFSAGNSGAGCNTVISPSDRPNAFSIGSTTPANGISPFSSRGPTPDGRRKPDVSAPGTSIVSSGHEADTQYRTLSGTSMAAPHVAGVAALLIGRNPGLTSPQVQNILRSGAVPITASGQTCGGTPDSGLPNNTVGDGRIDIINSFNV